MNLKNIFFLLVCMPYAHGMFSRMQAHYVKKIAHEKMLPNIQRQRSTHVRQWVKTQEWSRFEIALAKSFAGSIFAIPGGIVGCGLGVVATRTASIPYSYFSKIDSLKLEEVENKAATIGAFTGAFVVSAAIGGPVGVASTAVILTAFFRDDLIRKPSSAQE